MSRKKISKDKVSNLTESLGLLEMDVRKSVNGAERVPDPPDFRAQFESRPYIELKQERLPQIPSNLSQVDDAVLGDLNMTYRKALAFLLNLEAQKNGLWQTAKMRYKNKKLDLQTESLNFPKKQAQLHVDLNLDLRSLDAEITRHSTEYVQIVGERKMIEQLVMGLSREISNRSKDSFRPRNPKQEDVFSGLEKGVLEDV